MRSDEPQPAYHVMMISSQTKQSIVPPNELHPLFFVLFLGWSSLDNFWMGIVFEPLWYLIDFQIADSHLKWQLLIFDLRTGLKIGWVNDTHPTLVGS